MPSLITLNTMKIKLVIFQQISNKHVKKAKTTKSKHEIRSGNKKLISCYFILILCILKGTQRLLRRKMPILTTIIIVATTWFIM